MVIKIYDNHIEGCAIGISAPADANLDIGTNRFVACEKAIDIRAPEALLGGLGLNPDTPLEVLYDVLAYLGADRRTGAEISEKVQSTGLLKWLSAGADASTLICGLGSLMPNIPQILATF